jgi:hypothetical protein
MINFNFNIRNPWSSKWKNYRCFHGSTPFEYKFWELQFYRSSDVLDFALQVTARQSHSGIRFCLGLFSFNVEFQFYDNRHWNHELEQWEN